MPGQERVLHPVWTRVAALVRHHAALRDLLGGAPSEWACYRFAAKLREHSDLLAGCLDAVVARRDVRPVIPLRMTGRVVKGEHKPPTCEHGTWTFAGADAKRQATKWRCPTGACKPASRWVKADRLHPLIPRETDRYKALYRERTAVERGFGRLKSEWAMLPLRVRQLERVRLHVDLTMLACLGTALDRRREILAA